MIREYGDVASRHRSSLQNPDSAEVDVVGVMQHTFGMWDEIREDIAAAEEAADDRGERPLINDEGLNFDNDNVGDDDVDLPWGDPDAMDREAAVEYNRIQESARIPLFEGSYVTCLQATIMMLNMFRCNKASNMEIDQAFALNHRVLLPQPNTLPDSEYEASLMLRRLGLEFESIHVCPNNCVLFRGPFVDYQMCPNCRSMRMRKHGKSWVPQKVLRRFPLSPRLKRMFRSSMQAASMTWHARPRLSDGLVRHVSQSKHMIDIQQKESGFCRDARHLFLALTTDGINPFSEKKKYLLNVARYLTELQRTSVDDN